jgi:hypothetical protein
VAALVVGFNLVLWRMLDNNSHDVSLARAAEIATCSRSPATSAEPPRVPHLTGTHGCSREESAQPPAAQAPR